jgi:hypothetical protein
MMTVDEIVDAIWAHPSRTVDALTPSASNGSYIDSVAYAVWTYPTRTVSGGVSLVALGQIAEPTTGKPAVGQTHTLTALGQVSEPTTGQPQIGQTHTLTARGQSALPVTGKPVLSVPVKEVSRTVYGTGGMGDGGQPDSFRLDVPVGLRSPFRNEFRGLSKPFSKKVFSGLSKVIK